MTPKTGDEVHFEDHGTIRRGIVIGDADTDDGADRRLVRCSGENGIYSVAPQNLFATRDAAILAAIDRVDADLKDCVDTIHALQARLHTLKLLLGESA